MTARRPYAIALAMLAGVGTLAYFAFHPSLPFVTGYRVDAVFQSSNGLRKGAPVRVAGVQVGEVVGIGKGPGTTTVVSMKIDDGGRPVHRDATARIRPRVFLEGGFLVELSPGTPSAAELPDDGTIPLAQTSVPVQFHQLLTVFDAPARESLRVALDGLAGGFADGGAEGLRALAPEAAPLLRDLAWVGEASRGTRPGEVTELVASTAAVAEALDRRRELGRLVDGLAGTARAVRARDAELGRSIREAAGVVREAPGSMRALDRALPAVERAGRRLTPALRTAPRALRETSVVLDRLGMLVAPQRRATTMRGLRTGFRDLPLLVGALAAVIPAAKPVTDCLSSHVLPVFESEVPDGALSTGRPMWQDFAHALVGLAGGSQNFDGNGHNLRYQVGLGETSLSTGALPVLGPLRGLAPPALRSRPLPPAGRRQPPFEPDAPCARQPRIDLTAPSGSAALRRTP